MERVDALFLNIHNLKPSPNNQITFEAQLKAIEIDIKECYFFVFTFIYKFNIRIIKYKKNTFALNGHFQTCCKRCSIDIQESSQKISSASTVFGVDFSIQCVVNGINAIWVQGLS